MCLCRWWRSGGSCSSPFNRRCIWTRAAGSVLRGFASDAAPRFAIRDRLGGFGPLAAGVHASFEERKLHCGLKPSNVLVTAEGRVVVLDFGLVTEIEAR